jgi:hypothetical protein
MRYSRKSQKKSYTGKLVKFGIVAAICIVIYCIGWGNGQASAYKKMENETELYK